MRQSIIDHVSRIHLRSGLESKTTGIVKQLSGILVFLVVFFLAGLIMHFVLYEKAGVFIWSLGENPETGKPAVVRTTVGSGEEVISSDGSDLITASEDEAAEEKEEVLETAPAPEPVAETSDPNEIVLLNGKDLGQWEVTQFGGEGDVFVDEDGNLEFGFGAVMTGVHWGSEPPALTNYEISLDAKKLDGYDFFCALTFPVKDSHATFVLGGWGGGVVGISSVDDLNASENETMNIEGFENDRWYKIRVRVTDERLETWIDDDQKVDLALKDRKISLLPGDIELSVPIGLASYQTRAEYRTFVWRNLPEGE
ncbi:MAG: family 16 glycoside hydrolase [Verrucomicrobiota bacterium]